MFCSKCGSPLEETDQFCRKCGASVLPVGNINASVPLNRQRHGFTTFYLILGVIGGLIFGMLSFTASEVITEIYPNASDTTIMLMGLLTMTGVIADILLLCWKKSGFWLWIVVQIVSSIQNFNVGISTGYILLSIVGIVLMWGILHIHKNGKTTWEQLEPTGNSTDVADNGMTQINTPINTPEAGVPYRVTDACTLFDSLSAHPKIIMVLPKDELIEMQHTISRPDLEGDWAFVKTKTGKEGWCLGKWLVRNSAESDKKIPDNLFNPRDPETYQFAQNIPLVIDGVPIYDEIYKNDTSTKEAMTEKIFARSMSMRLEIQKKIEPEFNVIDFIEADINTKLDICSPMPQIVKTAGGYGFTVAQLEVLGNISDSSLEAIGKTMSSGTKGGKLKQALFSAHGSLNKDWHFLVKLHGINAALEKDVMWDYCVGYECETEEDVYKCYDSSEYLKSDPDMKKELIKYALENL